MNEYKIELIKIYNRVFLVEVFLIAVLSALLGKLVGIHFLAGSLYMLVSIGIYTLLLSGILSRTNSIRTILVVNLKVIVLSIFTYWVSRLDSDLILQVVLGLCSFILVSFLFAFKQRITDKGTIEK